MLIAQIWTAAALVGAQTPVQTPDLLCHGGVQIIFEMGSAQIDAAGAQRLEGFVSYWRERGSPGFVRIESGGDGVGDGFDRDLSSRRSEAVRAFLAARGHAARETSVAIGEEFGRPGDPTEDSFQQIGWVAQRIPIAEYRLLYPPNLIGECF